MDYSKVAVEINIIFKYIDDELVEQIPIELRQYFQEIASPTYIAHIDPRYPLGDQPLLRDTEILLAVLFRKYWATEEEATEFDEIIHQNDLYLRQKYDPNNIFKQVGEIKDSMNTSNLPSIPKENTFFNKFKNLCRKVWNTIFHLDENNINNDNNNDK